MAVPSSGTLSLGQIRQELETNNYAGGVFSSAATSLDGAENGSIKTINICSAVYPLSTNPANMSEWYGYDHDAPCTFATASYYFDGGIDTTDDLVTSGSLRLTPWSRLQANIQESWTLSMWVSPNKINEASVGDAGYQRAHGLWWIEDQVNGYNVDIQYNPSYTAGSDNFLECTISAGSGSDNYRTWQVPLDFGGANLQYTGVKDTSVWNNNNTGEVNGNGFIHLVFVYDDNQGTDEDKFAVYWNSNKLITPTYITGPGGSGPTGIPYSTGNQFAHFGRSATGGLSPGAAGVWYGWIGWLSYINEYAAVQQDVDLLYNSGTTPTQSDVTSVGGSMVLFELGRNVNPQVDYTSGNLTLRVITLDWDNIFYP